MERMDLTANGGDVGLRLDRYLAGKIPEMSRSEIQRAIRAGHVTIGGLTTRQSSRRLRQGEQILLETAIQPLLTPCLLYTSPSPRDRTRSRMPSSA